jgi:hypothetical protein
MRMMKYEKCKMGFHLRNIFSAIEFTDSRSRGERKTGGKRRKTKINEAKSDKNGKE